MPTSVSTAADPEWFRSLLDTVDDLFVRFTLAPVAAADMVD
ncbi:MAG: hypothetical protein AB7H96_17120 [Vicinamibacterales bacterium]